MSLPHVVGLALKLGHVILMVCCWIIPVIPMNWLANGGLMMDTGKPDLLGDGGKVLLSLWEKISGNSVKIQNLYYQYIGSRRVRNTWGKRLLVAWIVFWVCVSSWAFWYMSSQANEKRKETLASMCDERSRMLQDQFNVSMNHVQAMSIFISTFHHAKNPSAIDQETFARYTERTAFERPLTSGVAYAVRVLHSEREQFEKQQGWKIKRMDTLKETPAHKDEYSLEPLPAEDEYAPVIFAQDTVAHVISLDMMSGKEDRENVLRARESGKGVLTAPFPLLKTNRLGVILTFAVYNMDLPSNATPNERVQATLGYLGGIFDIESLVEKLLHQLASKQTIMVNVYDMTNLSNPISMYGCDETGDELQYVSPLSFGDPFRRHEMRCRLKQKPPWPWLAIATAGGILVIALLTGHIFHATVNRIARVEDDCRKMEKLKRRAEAADVAKSQFLATVSHEIRTPMNGVLGMLHMLMDTDLDVTQQDYVRTAQASGKALVSLINEVLDQAKIEANKIELEAVTFDLRGILDDVLSLFSGKSQEKGVELAVYISDRVPELVVGDPGRFRQIITNLMGNSVKFTEKGHIFATVHLVEELKESIDVETDSSSKNTLSGLAVADKRRSWAGFRAFFSEDGANRTWPSELVNVVVSVEDTGVGIPLEAHSRMFTPFMQVGPSISRTHGGTGIGLSISKYLVGLMNGEIGFSSVPKVGSTFTFTAALGKGSCNLDEQKKRQSGSATCELRGMTALVVDPRPVRAKVARYHIQRLGIGVEVAPDLITSSVCGGGGGGGSCSTNTNMVLVEQEVWDKDVSSSARFVNRLKMIASGTAPKLFVLTNSMCWSDVACGADTPTVIMKPLRASMLAASLRRALGVPSKGGSSCSTKLSSLSLRKLLRGRKILVVDDNNVNLRVAAGALKKYGADVVCADGGKKAISLLTPPHCFDACFMDIQMPEMDGFEATKRIREMERERIHNFNGSASGERWHVPILAMTADVIQATHEQCVKCEMDGYVSKPFEAEQLYREASRFFETKSD